MKLHVLTIKLTHRAWAACGVTEDYRSEVVKYRCFYMTIERIHRIKEWLHSHGQPQCKFIETKESVNIRKEFNSHRTGLGHQDGRRDVTWIISLGEGSEVYVPDYIPLDH